MSDPAEHPQIGYLDVPQAVIDEAGGPLDLVLSEFGAVVDRARAADIPASGWRLLMRWDTGAVVVGAPVDASGRSWRIAHADAAVPGAPPRTARVQSETLPLRPSRAERSRGLEMRWPAITLGAVDEALEVPGSPSRSSTPVRIHGGPTAIPSMSWA